MIMAVAGPSYHTPHPSHSLQGHTSKLSQHEKQEEGVGQVREGSAMMNYHTTIS